MISERTEAPRVDPRRRIQRGGHAYRGGRLGDRADVSGRRGRRRRRRVDRRDARPGEVARGAARPRRHAGQRGRVRGSEPGARRGPTGAYVQFLDADDVLHPEKIERQVRRLEREPEGTVATGPWVRFRGDVADADHTWSGPDWRDYEPATDWLLQVWGRDGGMPTVTWLTPRSVTEAAGPWDESVLRNQDGEYFARVVAQRRQGRVLRRGLGVLPLVPDGEHQQPEERRRPPLALRRRGAQRGRPAQPCGHGRGPTGVRGHVAGRRVRDCTPACRTCRARPRARARKLGAPPRQPRTIPSVRPIARVFGWRAGLRVQHVWNRVRHGKR